jgi:hypothetical protein
MPAGMTKTAMTPGRFREIDDKRQLCPQDRYQDQLRDALPHRDPERTLAPVPARDQ